MQDSIFWNKPPIRERGRSVDPLGFVALREAMADALVPLLSGATRSADDYIWTMIGLRWAMERTGSVIEDKIYNDRNYGFATFERALKQYWYKKSGRISGLGVNVVRDICDGARPDVTRQILVDQRGTGLLGNYVVSLRGMDLVEKNTITLKMESVDRLLGDISFNTTRDWLSSWNTLHNVFNRTQSSALFKAAKYRLGVKMFGENQSMRRAARSVLLSNNAKNWGSVKKNELDSEQAYIAEATNSVSLFEKRALNAFHKLLQGQESILNSEKTALRDAAVAVSKVKPFPLSWTSDNALRKAISSSILSLTRGASQVDSILQLHISITNKIRHNEPWISSVGEVNSHLRDWRPNTEMPDYRFGNLIDLIHQTGCRKHVV